MNLASDFFILWQNSFLMVLPKASLFLIRNEIKTLSNLDTLRTSSKLYYS